MGMTASFSRSIWWRTTPLTATLETKPCCPLAGESLATKNMCTNTYAEIVAGVKPWVTIDLSIVYMYSGHLVLFSNTEAEPTNSMHTTVAYAYCRLLENERHASLVRTTQHSPRCSLTTAL